MKLKIIFTIILCITMFSGCTGSAYINDSTEKADIQVKDGIFDVTVNECIDILNEDLAKEGLDLIPNEYETIEYDDKTVYRCVITNILMIQFSSYKEYGDGIVRITLSSIDSVKYKKGKKSFNYEATENDRKEAEKYYEIICNNVQPKFNADIFIKSGEGDTSEMNLDLGGLVFFGNIPSTDTWYGSETIEMNEVFSSDKLYDKEKLYDNDNVDDMFMYCK